MVLIAGGILFCISNVVLLSMAGFYLVLKPQVPDVSQITQLNYQTPLRIYSSDQKLIAEFGGQRRIPARIEQIPPFMIDAIVSIEDKRFYDHAGVDVLSVLSAIKDFLFKGTLRGASTITMQLARNVSLDARRELIRKLKEIILALQIEEELSKREILELYLNYISFGRRAFGVGAAAKIYYGIDLQDLSYAQMAMIAGLPQAPEAANPIRAPERALKRRNLVLLRMRDQGVLSNSDYQIAIKEPLTAGKFLNEFPLSADFVAEIVRQDALNKFGSNAYSDGYEITTTLVSQNQNAAREAVIRGLLAYDKRHGYRGSSGSLTPPATPLFTETEGWKIPETWLNFLQNQKTAGGLTPGIVVGFDPEAIYVTTPEGAVVTIPRKGFEWARAYISANRRGGSVKAAGNLVTTGDVIFMESPDHIANNLENSGWQLSQIPTIQSGFVSMDYETGAIVALEGGFDFKFSQFNNATQAKRQPGSGFKPFIYSAALENGFTPASKVNDAPIVIDDEALEGTYRPQNSDGRFLGEILLREGFFLSKNMISLRIVQDLSPESMIQYLKKFGFDTANFPANLQLGLGGGTVSLSPVDMAKAYSVFLNQGKYVEPFYIEKIKNNITGFVEIYQPKEPEQILDPRVAFQMQSMMKDVISNNRGTGRRARVLKRSDIGGKTGTTNDSTDTWFNGFGGNLITCVWVGFPDNSPVGSREFGSTTALPIWIDYMQNIKLGEASDKIPPNGIVQVSINKFSGLVSANEDKNTYKEWLKEEDLDKNIFFSSPEGGLLNEDIEAEEWNTLEIY